MKLSHLLTSASLLTINAAFAAPLASIKVSELWTSGQGDAGLTLSVVPNVDVSVEGWSLQFKLGDGYSLYGLWNGVVDSCPGNVCTVKYVDYNKSPKAGQDLAIGLNVRLPAATAQSVCAFSSSEVTLSFNSVTQTAPIEGLNCGTSTTPITTSTAISTPTTTTTTMRPTRTSIPNGPNPVYVAPNPPLPWITRNGTQLFEGSEPFRFISLNIPNLAYLEDRESRESRTFPTPWEQMDALRSIAQMGGRATRPYVMGVVPLGSETYIGYLARFTDGMKRAPGRWELIPGTQDFYANQDAFESMDWALAIASMVNVRLIWPFIDRWEWWGGIETFTSLWSKPFNSFYTDPELRHVFKMVIKYTLTRKNTVTGIVYKDDPVIAMWETGNELSTAEKTRVPTDWTIEMCRYMKEIDPKHLTMDGVYAYYGWEEPVLKEEAIDVYTNHYYELPPPEIDGVMPKPDVNNWNYWSRLMADAKYVTSFGKAFISGEAGINKLSAFEKSIEAAVENTEVVGYMIWSLRYHARDGGFYTHSEGPPYFSYHHPGFKTGGPEFGVDEYDMMDLIRRGAKAINSGTPLPPTSVRSLLRRFKRQIPKNLPASPSAMNSPYLTEVPTPSPEIIPETSTASGLIWRGSTGGEYYIIEKSTEGAEGPWKVVAPSVLDSETFGTVLWRDPEVTEGGAWYRVTGVNKYGKSKPGKAVKLL
ncbi:hypothetical protein HDV05_004678 [Chytridiales sp. JEL 0842]|nr:hypothetical protein HDV05_004678 [Chytridiales sp. JEL 0842]